MQHTQRALTLVLVDETVQVCLESGAQLRGRVGRRVRPIPVARLLAIEQLRLRPPAMKNVSTIAMTTCIAADLFWNQICVWRSCMPSSSDISLRRAAVGLLSAMKKRSRWVSCSGVTRDRFRFSRGSRSPPLAAFDDARVRCGPEAGSFVVDAPSAVSGESGAPSEDADSGTLSAGVRGDMDGLGDEAEDSGTMATSSSCAGSSLRAGFGSMLRAGTLARVRSAEMLSIWSSGSLAV